MGQQMLERERERENEESSGGGRGGVSSREKNRQSKLFSLQCGLIGEIEKWRKETSLVSILEAGFF